MSEDNFTGNEYEKYSEEEQYGGLLDGLTEKAVTAVLDKLGIDLDQIDKVKGLIDMIDFTREDGNTILVVKIGDNIEVKIKI